MHFKADREKQGFRRERLHPVHRIITKCIFNGQEHGEGRNHETHHFTEQRDD